MCLTRLKTMMVANPMFLSQLVDQQSGFSFNHHLIFSISNMNKKKLLLHTCCAPCVTVPIERLRADYEITCFFYNPNIHPEEEYTQRLSELQNLLKNLDIELIKPEYDSHRWFELVKGWEHEPEKGRRCTICFKMRLQQTAMFAKKGGFDSFTTVLSISPHKNATLINQIGAELSKQYQIEFLQSNFKKKDGYKRSIELSKLYDLYRQNYCGCIYSRREVSQTFEVSKTSKV